MGLDATLSHQEPVIGKAKALRVLESGCRDMDCDRDQWLDDANRTGLEDAFRCCDESVRDRLKVVRTLSSSYLLVANCERNRLYSFFTKLWRR